MDAAPLPSRPDDRGSPNRRSSQRRAGHAPIGWWAALALVGPGGCAIPSSYPGAPRVELGSTVGSFAPVADGSAVAIVHGIQGGYHVWGAVRAQYLDPRSLRARFELSLDDGTPALSTREDAFDLDGTPDGLTPGVHVGTTVFLTDPSQVRGRACRFSVQLTDREGREAVDSHRVIPVDGS